MPVRIYEIARRLGVESKVVLAKAKELNLTQAKVASSSLDKISAAFLEEELQKLGYGVAPQPAPKEQELVPQPTETAQPTSPQDKTVAEVQAKVVTETPIPAPPAEVAEPAPVVAAVPVELPTAIPPEVSDQPVTPLPPTPAEKPADVAAIAVTPEEVPQPAVEHAAPSPPTAVVEAPLPEPISAEPVTVHEGKAEPETGTATVLVAPTPDMRGPAEAPEVVAPPPVEETKPAVAAVPPPPAEPASSPRAIETQQVTQQQLPSAPPPQQREEKPPLQQANAPIESVPEVSKSSSPPAQAQSTFTTPTAAPPSPPKPKVGDKVGFIQLPTRPRPPEKPTSRFAHRGSGTRAEAQKAREPVAPARPATPSAQVQGGRATPSVTVQARRESVPPPQPSRPPIPVPTGEEIVLKPPVTVRALAEALKKKPFQVIADLMEMGVFATVNQTVTPEDAQRVCAKYNYRFKLERRQEGAGVHKQPPRRKVDVDEKPELLKPRPPVVTIMGHVDHGKTTLLDVIRKSNVAATEAGGITQHIGAYTIEVPRPGKSKGTAQITFLDTPGHAAFSAMRARGANVTDIVVLVVAANDGVMPQTLEAISHAKAANVPIVVAINKCDHPNANPVKVRQQLQEKGLVPDDWGGDTIFVEVSALTKQGIDKLLESILIQAELLDLRANPNRPAVGNVIESGIEAGGPVATLLVRKGTLSVGDVVVCEKYYGRVRALINEERKRLKQATPSMAVRMLGLNGVPEPGAEFMVVPNEKEAREICEQRAEAEKAKRTESRAAMTLSDLISKFEKESAKVLRVIVKGDTQGSVEAIVDALRKIESEKVSLEIIHSGVGLINESDVLLASASKAVVLGFHTKVDSAASELAKRDGVEIRLYQIIYELIDDVQKAMAGLLEPVEKEVVLGVAEVRKVFLLSKGGNVAGCVVTSGRIVKGKVRVLRNKNKIFDGSILTLRRFQEEVTEVRAGMECGIRISGFDDFAEGDLIECYSIEKVAPEL